MTKVIKGIAGVFSLTAIAFIICVITGLFSALNAAPAYTISTSEESSLAERKDSLSSLFTPVGAGSEVVLNGESNEGGNTDIDGVFSAAALGTLGRSSEDSSAGTTAGGTHSNQGSSSASTVPATTPPASSAPPVTAPSTPTAPTSPPATTAPQLTYHPPRDVWVESGYWGEESYPATTGERPVYGSICSECGANVSGQGAAHLKATHHSGYYEGVVGSETYVITPAGTRQKWFDTSGWVHYDGYWS